MHRSLAAARHAHSHGAARCRGCSAAFSIAFTVDFESGSRISLPISATSLRTIVPESTRVGDLPRLTGVSREANAMCTGWLARHDCVATEPDATARRGKVVRLTAKGEKAQQKYQRLLGATEETWRRQIQRPAPSTGSGPHSRTSSATGRTPRLPWQPASSPTPDNWRARVRRPETLPHHPMVLHRGGYPDGS